MAVARHDGSVKSLSNEEQWAQACVQNALPQCVVTQNDDGSRPAMYDLKLAYSDGSVGALEVTRAADQQELELWQLIGRRGRRWLVPELRGGWLVQVLPSARARLLFDRLPSLLRSLEHDDIAAIRGRRFSADPQVALASELRVFDAVQGPTAHPGSVYFMIKQPLERMGGFSPPTGDPLARWLGEWLTELAQADNLRKLAAASADERHVFVIVPAFSSAPFPVIDLLLAPGAPLPTIPPTLPEPLTHVWVASGWRTDVGFRYAPNVGWTEFVKVESADHLGD